MPNKAEPPKIDILNAGSHWQRWDPHIHAPGTAMNDQFGGARSLEDYLTALESASPRIRAIAVTDYYTTDTYQAVRAAKAAGRLPHCDLIFANVELRLGLQTVKGRFINLHLLVSPHGEDHVEQTNRFLSRLTFEAFGDTFACSRADLIRLGKASGEMKTSDESALAHGANQFKITLAQLQQHYRASDWAKANVLIALSGAETDGSSGMRNAADRVLREEMEKFAHIIFASSPAQRDFWLGLRTANRAELNDRYGGLKPCLHGSDAHKLADVGVPDGDRFTWIKGALNFDSLKQACIDPAGRAHVGPTPPRIGFSSQVISKVELINAPWAKTPVLALNPGLVTIIGARGSGKTALADVIAAGCDALPYNAGSASFLARAQNRNVVSGPKPNLLKNASVRLTWENGEVVERKIDGTQEADPFDFPRVRSLSQQFVDELCSADGMSDSLLGEIERVIFEAHDAMGRDGAVNFAEMRERKTNRYRLSRVRLEASIAQLSDEISLELEKNRQLPRLRDEEKKLTAAIIALEADRAKLVTAGSEARVERLTALRAAFDQVNNNIRYFGAQRDAVSVLEDEVNDFRSNRAPASLNQIKSVHKASGIKDDQWDPFLLDYKGDVATVLKERAQEAMASVASWRGTLVIAQDEVTPLIADDAELHRLPLGLLTGEIRRLEKLISVDAQTANRYKTISDKIDAQKAVLQSVKEKLDDAEQAKNRLTDLRAAREAAYKQIIGSIIAEQQALIELYSPLMERLENASGTLRKMSFSVAKSADIERWSSEGEKLFDLRTGSFRGKGSLKEYADKFLRDPWESGTDADVEEGMQALLTEHQASLLENANVPRSDEDNFRDWAKRFAKWLYGTSHIGLSYGINYDGVDIRHLSPGTRGIVLLLLYLALDDGDSRPLIIDQPEENLDPKSIFDELVQLFLSAKNRRQVIMVTHNANLVINTDADQIIVASTGPHPRGALPPITYLSGGLEEGSIRKAVCDILEGGEDAFKERARRLRVHLDR